MKTNYGNTIVSFVSEDKASLEGLRGVLVEFLKKEKLVSIRKIASTVTGDTSLLSNCIIYQNEKLDIPYNEYSWLVSVDDMIKVASVRTKKYYCLDINTIDLKVPDEGLLQKIAGSKIVYYSYTNINTDTYINTDPVALSINTRFAIKINITNENNTKDVFVLFASTPNEIIDKLNMFCKKYFTFYIDFSILENCSIETINRFLKDNMNDVESYIKVIPYSFSSN